MNLNDRKRILWHLVHQLSIGVNCYWMCSRSQINTPRVDIRLLNSVGFENIISMSSSGEDSSSQSELGIYVAARSVPDCKGQHVEDNELYQLRDAVAKWEEEKKLIEVGKMRLPEQLDKSTLEVEELKSKKQKKCTRKTKLTINTLRSDKNWKAKSLHNYINLHWKMTVPIQVLIYHSVLILTLTLNRIIRILRRRTTLLKRRNTNSPKARGRALSLRRPQKSGSHKSSLMPICNMILWTKMLPIQICLFLSR